MGKKIAAKKSRGRKTAEPPPVHPMDELRLKRIIRNNSRMQALGIPALSTLFVAKTVISPEKRPRNSTDESEAEYHPNEDDTSEGESSDDSLVHETEALQEFKSTPAASSNSKGLKDCKKPSQESSKKRSAAMPPGGVKPRPPKRVLADIPTNMRVTRSRKV
ncbi:uncharacterized protein [Aegilops tauschii subsp. strangulata]|uniref:uncharacterized protein isoform X1 n=1 Tax=Aegilops tauschii subsp. strangulata TaxID=200361 RepID=UPI001ABBF6AE|nr:uncharacterized protein LOC109739460 [Aegilops tauschii subsp. strangulata]